MFLERQRDFI